MLPQGELGHRFENGLMVLHGVRLEMKDGAEQVEILRLARPRLDKLLPGCRSIPHEHHGGGVKKLIVLARLRMAGEMNPARAFRKSMSLLSSSGSFNRKTRQRLDERFGNTRSSFVVMMTSGGSPVTLMAFLDPSGSELARAKGLQQSVGNVGVRLVDLVDQDDAPVARCPLPDASVGTGEPLSRACWRALIQSNAHQRGPGRRNRRTERRLRSCLVTLLRSLPRSPGGLPSGLLPDVQDRG